MIAKPNSKLVSYTTTAIFVVGLTIVGFAVTKIRNETLSMLAAFVCTFYFLAYGEIERFVMRLAATKSGEE